MVTNSSRIQAGQETNDQETRMVIHIRVLAGNTRPDPVSNSQQIVHVDCTSVVPRLVNSRASQAVLLRLNIYEMETNSFYRYSWKVGAPISLCLFAFAWDWAINWIVFVPLSPCLFQHWGLWTNQVRSHQVVSVDVVGMNLLTSKQQPTNEI